MTTYSYGIGYAERRQLRAILDTQGGGAQEYAAVERLYRFEGTADDVEVAARLYESVGEGANAANLRRGCYGPERPPAG